MHRNSGLPRKQKISSFRLTTHLLLVHTFRNDVCSRAVV